MTQLCEKTNVRECNVKSLIDLFWIQKMFEK